MSDSRFSSLQKCREAKLQAGQGRLEAARESLQEAIRLDAENTDAYFQLATIEIRRGQHSVARHILRALDSVLIDDPQVKILLAEVNEPLGFLDEAEDWLHSALALEPKSLESLTRLCEFYHRLQKVHKAEAWLAVGLTLFPDDSHLLRLLVSILVKQERLEDARARLESFLQLHPDSSEVKSALAELPKIPARPASEGEPQTVPSIDQEALESPAEAPHIPPEQQTLSESDTEVSDISTETGFDFDQEALSDDERGKEHEQARSLVSRGLLFEASERYREILSKTPEDEEALLRLGVILNAQGQCEPAAEFLSQALQLQPDRIETRIELGIACMGMGQSAEAEQHYREALGLNADNVKALINLAFLLSRQGQLDESEQLLQRAVKLQPRNPHARLGLGNVLFKKDRFREAAMEYQACLDVDRKNLQAHKNMALTWYRLGDLKNSASEWQNALNLDKTDKQAQENLALLASHV